MMYDRGFKGLGPRRGLYTPKFTAEAEEYSVGRIPF